MVKSSVYLVKKLRRPDMERQSLTPVQQKIYDYICQSVREKGYPPAVREIGAAVGLSSTSSVHSQLNNLERKGYIRRDPAKNRSIEITDESVKGYGREILDIPVVGTVTAGQPILAQENITGHFPISPDFMRIPNKETFMLKVKGESMINAHICDGDIVIVEKTPAASNGDIVVALLEDSATVKTFYKEKDHIRLQPENDHMDPIISADVTILGKVIGLFRVM